MGADGGMGGERLDISPDEVIAGGVFVGGGSGPAGLAQQGGGGGVDVHRPRREQTDVAPLADRGPDPVAGLHDGEGHLPSGEVGGGGQADRAGSDDDDVRVGGDW